MVMPGGLLIAVGLVTLNFHMVIINRNCHFMYHFFPQTIIVNIFIYFYLVFFPVFNYEKLQSYTTVEKMV